MLCFFLHRKSKTFILYIILGRILSSGATVGSGGIAVNEGDLTLTEGSGIVVEKNGGLVVEGTKFYI